MMDLDIGLCSEVEKKQKKKMLLDYLWENLRFHNWWAYRYYLCEVLALLNVIGEFPSLGVSLFLRNSTIIINLGGRDALGN